MKSINALAAEMADCISGCNLGRAEIQKYLREILREWVSEADRRDLRAMAALRTIGSEEDRNMVLLAIEDDTVERWAGRKYVDLADEILAALTDTEEK